MDSGSTEWRTVSYTHLDEYKRQVNGQVATQRGKKLVDGDVVEYKGETIKIVK